MDHSPAADSPPPSRFDVLAVASGLPESSDTMLVDRYLTDLP